MKVVLEPVFPFHAFKTLYDYSEKEFFFNSKSLNLKYNVSLNVWLLNWGGLLNCRIRAILSSSIYVSILKIYLHVKVGTLYLLRMYVSFYFLNE